jgi:hypothetical protein
MGLVGGGDLRDALFVTRDPDTGEPAAIDLRTANAGGTPAPMLDFRLDEQRRRVVTNDALAPGAGRVGRAVVEQVAAALEPGGSLLVVVTTGRPSRELEDASARTGGILVADEPAGSVRIADLEPGALVRIARAAGRTATSVHPI